jgi:tetratricopeptide (TPR) repeat protein
MDLFQQAIALDPNYALAWAGVADCMAQFLQHHWTDEGDRFRKEGLEAAQKAIAIDPDLAEGHKAEANILMANSAKVEEAARSLRRAIRANPRYTPAMTNLGVLSVSRYDLAMAERMYRRAVEVDPQDNFSRIWLSVICFWTFREEEGLGILEAILEGADSEFYVKVPNTMAALLHAKRGDLEAAEAAIQGAVDSPLVPYEAIEPMVGWIRALRGRTDEARTILRKINTHGWSTMGFGHAIMEAALAAGDWDEAVRAASYVKDEGWLPMVLRLNPELHPLLEHEEFGPPRCEATLTWPLQAPMVDEARFRLFRKVEIQSGLPEGEDPLGESSIGD